MGMRRSAVCAAIAVVLCGCGGDEAGGPVASDGSTSDTGDGSDVVSCEPGEVRCAGTRVERCLTDATTWDSEACPADSGCLEGVCAPQICVPGLNEPGCLDVQTHQRCNDAGTALNIINCDTGDICRNGACTGQICLTGETECAGFTQTRRCDVTGFDYETPIECPPGGTCSDGTCLSPCDTNIKNGSYLGCSYWAVDTDNVEEAQDQPIGVVVSVPAGGASTEVIITNNFTGFILTAGALGVSDLFVQPGQLKVFRLPIGYDIDGSKITDRTFSIETDTPVSVHQFNPLNGDNVYSNDASLLLPAQVTGGEHLVMSWPHRGDAAATLRGFVTVIASQPGVTTVQVTPTAWLVGVEGDSDLPPGQTRLFQLRRGQALNLQTRGDDHGDMTGTVIVSNRQSTVIAGHECANIPVGVSACDHIEQQLIPVNSWGNRYLADGFSPRSDSQVDLWRVMAGRNDITVTTTPPVPGYERFKLQRGTWVQFASSASFEVLGDGPISVGHYLSGANYPGATAVCGDNGFGAETGIGDPAFTLQVPTNRFLKRYVVLTPSGYLENYLNVMAPASAVVLVDGNPISGVATPLGDLGWTMTRVAVEPGVHEVEADDDFGLTVYGYDCEVSYAYPGGLQLQTFVGETL
ncbi:MAG: hypothetical protein ACI9MR_004235 [Myxococcota bacterium]|jgi:hypothetical protein